MRWSHDSALATPHCTPKPSVLEALTTLPAPPFTIRRANRSYRDKAGEHSASEVKLDDRNRGPSAWRRLERRRALGNG